VVLAAHIVVAPAAAVIRRIARAPTVLYLYGKEVGASPGLSSFALRNSDLAIVISEYTRDLALGAGGDAQRLRLVPPGVDVVTPEPTERHERPTILTVARLEDHYKGHDVLARALPVVRARVPGVEWVVIGDGPLRRTIERLGRANQVSEHIRLLGSVTDVERNWWLDRAQVFSMPSRLPAGKSAGEGFGIVYLEAGLHRLPVVAGNVGGACDAVIHEQTGLLVDPTSSLAVGDALADLLLDRQRAAAMGEAGRQHALSFGWDRIAPRIEDVLLEAARR
jgi:phosphatidylinositol alpha-1,6-mannosyltransferase